MSLGAEFFSFWHKSGTYVPKCPQMSPYIFFPKGGARRRDWQFCGRISGRIWRLELHDIYSVAGSRGSGRKSCEIGYWRRMVRHDICSVAWPERFCRQYLFPGRSSCSFFRLQTGGSLRPPDPQKGSSLDSREFRRRGCWAEPPGFK